MLFPASEVAMRESLTDAVKSTAGVSLTEEVKRAGGDSAWPLEEAVDAVSRPGRRRLLAMGMRCTALALLAYTLLLAWPTPLDAERQIAALHPRVAFVVGNSAYLHTSTLGNPKHDAGDIGAALRRLGFHVIEGFDLDKAAFDRQVREFAAALQGADVGVFFYAGHGLQVSGRNYLVPVDAQLSTGAALELEMVPLDLVQRAMERAAKTSILFFDACRDNPLTRRLARAMGTRSAEIGSGLAPVRGGVGTLISFSTQPGMVALDGRGRNSPFSGALSRHLGASGDDLNAVLIAVRNDVMRETDGVQVPWENSALTGRFYFNPNTQVTTGSIGTHLRLSEAAEAWNAAKDTTSIAVLEAFLARYPNTFFAELARARIEELRKPVARPRQSTGAASR
jgi:uncharacterized caspase-like protein